MFKSAAYKKQALQQLKNRWKMPCVFTLMMLVINCALSYSSRYGFMWEVASACVAGVLGTALYFVFLKMQDLDYRVTFDSFFEGLECWLHALLGTLWFLLWVFLWALLFFIPGIVKAYSYSMMFFVIAETPEIGPKKALQISKVLTNGHKADLFMMSLSFLGWGLLSLLTCGIGFIWLVPYSGASFMNAYIDLKKMAFAAGTLTPADFSCD